MKTNIDNALKGLAEIATWEGPYPFNGSRWFSESYEISYNAMVQGRRNLIRRLNYLMPQINVLLLQKNNLLQELNQEPNSHLIMHRLNMIEKTLLLLISARQPIDQKLNKLTNITAGKNWDWIAR